MKLDSKIPEGSIAEKWTRHKFNLKLVNPANKRKYDVIVVGTGLAGASAAGVAAGLACLSALSQPAAKTNASSKTILALPFMVGLV